MATALAAEANTRDFADQGDFDADGTADFAYLVTRVADVALPESIQIMYGTGEGIYVEGPHIDVDAGDHLEVADLDQDGWDDLLYYVIGAGVHVAWNDNGCFTEIDLIADGPAPLGHAQFLGDAAPEIFLNGGGPFWTVLENNGDRSFSTWGELSFPMQPPLVGDIDGNDRIDYVYLPTPGPTLTIGLQQADGSFEEVDVDATSLVTWIDALTGDLDDDGTDEIVVYTHGEVRVLDLDLGDPMNPSLDETTSPAPVTSPTLVPGRSRRASDPVVLLGSVGTARRAYVLEFAPDATVVSTDAGEIRFDRGADHVLLGSPTTPLQAIVGIGATVGATFSFPFDDAGTLDVPAAVGVPAAGTGRPVALDVNGDGLDDVVARGASPGVAFSILLSDGLGSFAPPIDVTTPASVIGYPATPEVADLDTDGDADLLLTFQNPNPGIDGQLATWRSDGDSLEFAGATSLSVGSLPRAPTLGDFDGDGALDWAVPHGGGLSPIDLDVGFGNGDGTFAALTEIELPVLQSVDGNLFDIATAGDLDGEPGDEFVTLAIDAMFSGEQQLASLAWDGAAFVELDPMPNVFPEWDAFGLPESSHAELLVRDLDGDADNDVVLAFPGLGWGVAYGDGAGGWEGSSRSYEFLGQVLMTGLHPITHGDVTGFLLCGQGHFTTVLLGSDARSVRSAFAAGWAPTSGNACVGGDFDGDGLFDVAATVDPYQLEVVFGVES